jgi:hypothetical protein
MRAVLLKGHGDVAARQEFLQKRHNGKIVLIPDETE